MADIATSSPSAAPAAAPVSPVLTSNATPAQEGEGQPVTAPAAEAKAIQDMKKKFKIKVDNQEYDEVLDFNDEEAIKKHLQFSKVAQKRMQETKDIEKNFVNFLAALKADPASVLSDPRIGIDMKKMAAAIIEKEIEDSAKSPDQVKAEKLEAELKSLRDEREKEMTAAQEREFKRMEEEAFVRYDTLLDKALSSNDIPKNPYYIKKIANYMALGLQNGLDVTPEDVLPMVKNEVAEEFRQLIGVMPLDMVEDFVGKDVIKQIRKKYIDKAKKSKTPASTGAARGTDSGARQPEPEAPREKIRASDFFRNPLAFTNPQK